MALHGAALVRQLESEVDFLPVVRTAVMDCGLALDGAVHSVDAFLQWFSLIGISERIEHYVMLRGDVDRVWHAMILNTALYRDICRLHMDRFIDHHSNSGVPHAQWVLETVDFIESEFSDTLHPAFSEWRATALGEIHGEQDDGPDPVGFLSSMGATVRGLSESTT